jgi:hypothetical protein
MFRALLAHLQDSLQKHHLVCCVRVMFIGCTSIEVEHARNIPSVACAANPEDEQVTFETCRGP